MSKKSTWLLDHQRDVHSQDGEDGIIEKILSVIPNNNWCVEFGAWDGLYLTNTKNLIESKDASAVLIEADNKKFKELQTNYSKQEKVITVNQFVGFKKDDNLDHILNKTPIPLDFDLLSIDVDGNDFHIWKAFTKYKPKVIVIEFNPTIPTHINFVQPADPKINQGASLKALVELGKSKGYELVSVLPWNAFFIKKEYFSLFELESNTPEALRTDLTMVTYIYSGYDGKIFLDGARRLLWHSLELKESNFQILPKFLRKYPGNYNLLHKTFYAIFILITRPSLFIKLARKALNSKNK